MAAELPRPGVEVIQVFRTVSPTVVTPTLTPCVVGVCKQIVDVLVPAASGGNEINTSALISLPAFFIAAAGTGNPVAYGGLNGLNLIFSINYGPDVTVTFSGASLSPVAVVDQVNAALAAAGVTEAVAETVGSDTWRLITLGVGEFQTIEVKSTSGSAVLSAFGLIGGYLFAGVTSYDQDRLTIPQSAFPDPRSNLDELSIEADSIRVFLSLGSGTDLRELSRTQAFLRNGGGGTAAQLTGTVSLGTGGLYGGGGTLAGTTLQVQIDDATSATTINFVAPADVFDLLAQVNNQLGDMYGWDLGGGLALISKTKGPTSRVRVTGGTAVAVLGFSAPNNDASGTAGVKVVDDGNGDALSPIVDLGVDLTAVATAAVATGKLDITALTYPGDVQGKQLTLAVTGREPQTLVFSTPTANAAAVLTQINTFWSGLLVATINGSNQLVLTTVATGEEANIEIVGGNAAGVLGLVGSVTGTINLVDISPDLTTLNAKKLRLSFSGTIIEHTFSGLLMASTAADVATNLNTTISSLGTASVLSGKLHIISKLGGEGTYVQVLDATSAEAARYLGFSRLQKGELVRVAGGPHPPLSGDDLYVDGELVGRITQVAPGAVVNRVRVDKQLAITADFGDYFYIIAKNLSVSSSTRPTPELVVSSGVPTLKQDVLRDTIGNIVKGKASIYLSYRAVRLDVTARAKKPGLLRLDNTTQVEDIISPISTLNPLALGFYFALLNAPGAQVSGLGVDAVSADSPLGTVEAFTRAAEFLEGYEVYAIAPLTHDETVAQVFNTHVTSMSAPASKGERICLFNFEAPAKKLDKLVASGLNGNSTAATQFDTGVVNLAALLQNSGVNPVGTIPVSAGVFLDIASNTKKYSVASIAGGVITIRTSFAAGENDDGFYSTTDLNDAPLPSSLINEPFGVRIRGAALTLPDGSPDKQGMAETYQALAQTFLNRRFWSIVGQTAATLNGLEQNLDGFYLCAGIAGMIGQQPPQQSFTNFPMSGFTRVTGTNDFFSEKQLNVIAAGGNYIVVQDADGAPLTSRMALTTDMTSIETRTDSIQKVVDFTAKFLRRGLKSFIGRFNITSSFLDSLGSVVQGLLGFLVDLGVLIGANVNNLIQDEDAPDTVLIDVTLDVPYPCNYIRLTLVI